jgi:hypothetical protein
LYNYLLNDDKIEEKGIPKVHLTTVESDYNIMIMDLLGIFSSKREKSRESI